MTPAQRDRADELFLRAVELPDGERPGFLDGNCDGDPEIRREVESLLRHDGRAAFLDTATPTLRAADLLTHHAKLPERIGGYRVLRKIGQGGVATVYEAEQESTRRRVALKVVPAAHASRNLHRRFEREIQILGELKHPGIATIYDAGVASIAGVPAPYLAMELVNGLPITEFADKYGLGVRERLALVGGSLEVESKPGAGTTLLIHVPL
ncbi:MAG: protein kinase [Phycisphaerales bacterium]|nr:protein kinase [Phycisphaerales bacterium]